eukprot:4530274-Pyramimonas_sp.AAC.1
MVDNKPSSRSSLTWGSVLTWCARWILKPSGSTSSTRRGPSSPPPRLTRRHAGSLSAAVGESMLLTLPLYCRRSANGPWLDTTTQ